MNLDPKIDPIQAAMAHKRRHQEEVMDMMHEGPKVGSLVYSMALAFLTKEAGIDQFIGQTAPTQGGGSIPDNSPQAMPIPQAVKQAEGGVIGDGVSSFWNKALAPAPAQAATAPPVAQASQAPAPAPAPAATPIAQPNTPFGPMQGWSDKAPVDQRSYWAEQNHMTSPEGTMPQANEPSNPWEAIGVANRRAGNGPLVSSVTGKALGGGY